jgi:hypothetical protein
MKIPDSLNSLDAVSFIHSFFTPIFCYLQVTVPTVGLDLIAHKNALVVLTMHATSVEFAAPRMAFARVILDSYE